MKTDLMSELEFLQLLAELGEEGLVLPDHHTGSTHQIKKPQKTYQTILKGGIKVHYCLMWIRICQPLETSVVDP